MAYTKQVWRDNESGGTPITADRLNHMEDGIEENSKNWDSISPAESDGWLCSVYPNGYAECSKSFDFDVSSAEKVWSGRAAQVDSIAYPFAFAEVPCLTYGLGNSDPQGGWIDAVLAPSGTGTGGASIGDPCSETGPFKVIALDGQLETARCRISFRAFGKLG